MTQTELTELVTIPTTRGRHIEFIPFDLAATPKTGPAYADVWCVVHPEHGVACLRLNRFDVVVQCNEHRRAIDRLASELYAPWAEVRHLPVVFRAHVGGTWMDGAS